MTIAPSSEADGRFVDLDSLEPIRIGPTWQRNPDHPSGWLLPELTLGWHAVRWQADNLQHSSGRPWRYTPEQLRFILWWYAVGPDLRWLFRDGVLQRLKGWGKDPVVATISATGFVGPARPDLSGRTVQDPWGNEHPAGVPHPEAWVQIAAVSKDQTRNTMTLFPGLFTPAAIERYSIDLGKEIIYAHKGAKRIEAVTSSPRALEGGRPTEVVRNETHHWLSSNEGHEMDAVIDRNAVKSSDGMSRALSITNAYMPGEDSVAERARDAYELIQAGKSLATGLLYDSLEAPPEAPLSAEAAPKVVDLIRGDSSWLDVQRIVQAILDPRNPPSRSRRFWYNQIVAAEDAWIAPYQWDALAKPERLVMDGEQITVFFDGSKSDDATVLVGCCISDGHVFLLDHWQRPAGLDAKLPWVVPRDEVDAAVDRAFDRWQVRAFFADPGSGEDESGERFWDGYIDGWATRHGDSLVIKATATAGGHHAVMWDMRSPARQQEFTEATERCFSDITSTLSLSHDGNRVLRQHAVNARRRPNRWGVSIGKEHRESVRKIDAAVGAIGARMVRRKLLASPEWKKQTVKKPRTGRVYGFN